MEGNSIISALGGGSGINTTSLVEGLIAAERMPKETQLTTRQEKLDLQLSGYGVMASALSTLQESVTLLGDSDTFNSKGVSFTDNTVLTPTSVDADALAGEYQVVVTGLARSQSLSSGQYEAMTDPVGKGEMQISFGSWDGGSFTDGGDEATASITIDDSNNTLQGLRDAINDADVGVQASIIQTGDEYQLQITAPAGASNELSIEVIEEGTTAGDAENVDATGLSLFAFNESGEQLASNQEGADATLTVNGMEVTRESNKITDVIHGLEFTLNKVDPAETVTFTITDDTYAAETAVRDFVTAYNDFFATMEKLTDRSATPDTENEVYDGSLASDPSARSVLTQVRTMLRQSVTGLTGDYSALSNVGIMTTLEGDLEINEDRFTAAFEDHFDEVVDLFNASTNTTDSRVQVLNYKTTTAAGAYPVEIGTDPAKGYIDGGNFVTNTEWPETSGGNKKYDKIDNDWQGSTFTATGNDYTFKVSIDGTESETITLTGDFTTVEQLREALEDQINTDATLKAAGVALDVEFNDGGGGADDSFSFISRSWGSDSVVSFTEASANMANMGVTVASGTNGVDVAGTIDGETGFGSGNILLPPVGSDLAGLSLRVLPDASSAADVEVTYSRGFGVELSNLINSLLADQGLIDRREENINSELEDIEDDMSALDDRMARRTIALEAQFIAMERIIASMSETEGMLDGLTDRLPFTAKG